MRNFKKLFSMLAIAAILGTSVPTAVLGAADYSDELLGAYDYAYGVGITTQSSVDSADMYGSLKRSHMAKMMSNYAKEVLGSTPDTTKACAFTDVANETAELQGYITEACQLGLMGIDLTAFNPNGAVTRAQFGTVLSRALYGDANNGGTPYYANHLTALQDAGVMNNISTPNAPEVRGYVMLMMERADTGNSTPSVCSTPENVLSCSLGLSTCPAECVTDTTLPTGDGTLSFSTTSNFNNGQSFPVAAGIKVASIKLSASTADVVVSNITLLRKWVGLRTDISGVALMMNGMKITKTKTISSEDKVEMNLLTPVTIKAGSSETFDVIVTTASAVGEHYFQIAVDAVSSNAKALNGLPLWTTMFKTSTTNAGQLTISTDGSLSTIKLGDKAATVAKFKVDVNSVEDVTLNSLTFKKDSATATHQDSDLENFKLTINDVQVAATAAITNKYVTFNLSSSYKLEKNKTAIKFAVTADIVAGAGKIVAFVIDSDTDVMANGSNFGYGALISGRTNVNQSVTISAGAITLDKVNALSDKIVKNKKNVEFGKFTIKSNSKDVELSALRLTIVSTNDAPGGVVFAQIENLEIYNSTNWTVYDLSYVSGGGTKLYRNTDMGLIIKAGTTHHLVVRADTLLAGPANGDYTISIANATADLTIKETANDVAVTDITPNALSLKKVTITAPSVAFSRNAISAALNAVVGSSDVLALDFNVLTNLVDSVKVTELKFADMGAGTMDNTRVSGFKLWKLVGSTRTLVKETGTSQLAAQEVTFNSLTETIAANTMVNYRLTVSFVKDASNAGQQFNLRLSAYSTESTDQGTAVYDAVADNSPINGIITVSEVGATTLLSARTVALVAVGSLTTATDNTNIDVNKDLNLVAGSTSPFVAAFRMTVANESVRIKDFTVTASTNVSASVAKIQVYANDKTTLIAEMPVTAAITTFTNVANFVMPVGADHVYIKLITRAMGKDLPGAQAINTTYTFAATVVEGADSGDTITATNAGGASKNITINPTKVSAVTFVTSALGVSVDSKLTNGANIVGILAVTAEANGNIDSVSAAALKTQLNTISVSLALADATVGMTNLTIERIGGTDAAIASTNSAGKYLLTLTAMTNDRLIPAGQTYYYKLVATVAGLLGTTVGSLQAKLVAPDAGDFVYDDNDSFATITAVSALRLWVSTIDGLKINQN